MDSFKDLLQETIGQIKQANKDAADLQMKEIKSSNSASKQIANKLKTSSTWS